MSTLRAIGSLAAAPLLATLALAACGGSSTKPAPASRAGTSKAAGVGAPGIVTVTRDGLTASMHPQSRHPVVERPWPISFTVTRSGRPARASVSYEYLLDEQVVARRDHYAFDGHFADVFKWPAAAVGYPLTFRAVIQAAGTVIDLDYPVQVVR
jgi:hypothetical protein